MKNRSAIVFRIGSFVVLAAIIVALFPRYKNGFRYHYEVGKPWGYTTLTAPFEFPIYKTENQLEEDKQKLMASLHPISDLFVQTMIN